MKNIVLIGLTGCGKTTIGKQLAPLLNMDFVDMDSYIEKKEGKTVKEIFASRGETYFRSLETIASEELSQAGGKVIATGGGVVLNPKNIDYLKQNGIIIFLDRSPQTILRKINLSIRPMLAENKNRLYELDKERRPLYEAYADLTIPGGTNVKETLSLVLSTIKERL